MSDLSFFVSLAEAGKYAELFRQLGWDTPTGERQYRYEGDEQHLLEKVAQFSGLAIWVCQGVPSRSLQLQIVNDLRAVSTERLVIFHSAGVQHWRWPRHRQLNAVNAKLMLHEHVTGERDLAFEDRLQSMLIGFDDNIGLVELIQRMRAVFDKESETASMKAARLMDDLFIDLNKSGAEKQAPQVLARLLFLWFGDDTQMWTAGTFENWILNHTTEANFNEKLTELFAVLDNPKLDRLPDSLPEEYRRFRYINGGLFGESLSLPALSGAFRQHVLDACKFDWSIISPAIFGSMFQNVKSATQRRDLGEHYTTEENILRTIRPLFLDELEEALQAVWDDPAGLRKYQQRLAQIRVLDPACGCGNFLIVTYRELRSLETAAIARSRELYLTAQPEVDSAVGLQSAIQMDSDLFTKKRISAGDVSGLHSKIQMRNFAGIEIEQWPAAIAQTAMLLVDHLANQTLGELFGVQLVRLPIDKVNRANIVLGNSLRTDWSSVIELNPKSEFYIVGNPPFIGYSSMTKDQDADMAFVFNNMKGHGVLDYVTAWYRKAADYLQGTKGKAAFVSTNSIVQGQQVTPLWRPLFETGLEIDFAYQNFLWESEALTKANVWVVIIGFSYTKVKPKLLFEFENNNFIGARRVANINGYLLDAPSIFIDKHTKPLCNVPEMSQGFKPADGGKLLMRKEERDNALQNDATLVDWIRPFSMGEDFIKGKERFCLWLPNVTAADFNAHPFLVERVEACRDWRAEQTPSGDAYKLLKTPHLLRPCNKFVDSTYIGIPSVSSDRRSYVPIGFIKNGMIPGNMLYFIPTDSLYIFGMMMSQYHNAWMRAVCGRIGMGYRYANTIVYNNFIWPDPSDSQRLAIETAAQAVLDARALYPDATLEDMYEINNAHKFPELSAAHLQLDRAVEAAYGTNFNGDESQIVAHLFNLYVQKTKNLSKVKSKSKKIRK